MACWNHRFTCSDVSCRGVRARYGCVPVTSIRAGRLRQRKGIADRSRCHADRWQVYRLELYFRQGYDFSSSARHEVGGAPGGFLLGEPASLRFNGGKIILYGTRRRILNRLHQHPKIPTCIRVGDDLLLMEPAHLIPCLCQADSRL